MVGVGGDASGPLEGGVGTAAAPVRWRAVQPAWRSRGGKACVGCHLAADATPGDGHSEVTAAWAVTRANEGWWAAGAGGGSRCGHSSAAKERRRLGGRAGRGGGGHATVHAAGELNSAAEDGEEARRTAARRALALAIDELPKTAHQGGWSGHQRRCSARHKPKCTFEGIIVVKLSGAKRAFHEPGNGGGDSAAAEAMPRRRDMKRARRIASRPCVNRRVTAGLKQCGTWS